MSTNYDNLQELSKDELIDKVKKSIAERKSLEYLLDNLNGIAWEFDLNLNRFTYVSANAKVVLGYELYEWLDFPSWIAMIHEDDRERISSYCSMQTQAGNDHYMEYKMIKKNGDVIWALDAVTLARDENNNTVKLYGFILDITEKKENHIKIKKEHKFLETVLNSLSDPIMIVNANYTINAMNDKFIEKLKDRTFKDPKSPKCYEISHYLSEPCSGKDHPCPLKYVLEHKKITSVLHKQKQSDGSNHFFELAASPLFDDENNCVGIIESARNVTSYINLTNDLQEKTKQLKYQANYDSLTGLPNRALFNDKLEHVIKDAKRNKTSFALFFMDLDYFKDINDTFGHSMGDAVLKKLSQKFKLNIRENDIISRLGGDEFTIIMKDIKSIEDVSALGKKFIDIFKEPLIIDGHSLRLSTSIGISIYLDNDEKGDDLIKFADEAMYKAKEKGKNNFQFYSKD